MYPNTECVSDCYRPGDCDGSCTHPRSVAAPQQPAHKADAFRNMFAIIYGLEAEDLPFMTAEQRQVFFWDPVPAILRLDDARLDALYALVQERQPARYRSVGEVA